MKDNNKNIDFENEKNSKEELEQWLVITNSNMCPYSSRASSFFPYISFFKDRCCHNSHPKYSVWKFYPKCNTEDCPIKIKMDDMANMVKETIEKYMDR